VDCWSRSQEAMRVMSKQEVIAQQLARVVKERRTTLGLSQEELAHQASIDRTYASQIERAIANPSLSVLCNLATVLNLSFAQLVGEQAIPPVAK
jgi:transcriptional regulator with XRE-family HTH domain